MVGTISALYLVSFMAARGARILLPLPHNALYDLQFIPYQTGIQQKSIYLTFFFS